MDDGEHVHELVDTIGKFVLKVVRQLKKDNLLNQVRYLHWEIWGISESDSG